MDQVWSYRRGSWTEATTTIPFVDGDGEQMEELEGYDVETLWLGLEGGFQVEVYTRLKDNRSAPAPYLVILYMGGDNREYVFVEDLPSLLQFLNEISPIIQCSNEDIEAERDMVDDDMWADVDEDQDGEGTR